MIRERKSTRKTAPIGVKTQGQCSGHEICNNGNCNHRKSWFWQDPRKVTFKK